MAKSKEVYRSGDDRVVVKQNDSGSGNRADVYIGSKENDSHCHAWVDKDGGSGVEHRGQCDGCR